jgi:hypothetical protein
MLGGEPGREERLLSRMSECVDRVGAYDDMIEGLFRLPSPQRSGMIGVAQEPRPCKHDSTTTYRQGRMINALERPERAAHRGDSDTVFFIFIVSINHSCPCMICIMLLLPTERDG